MRKRGHHEHNRRSAEERRSDRLPSIPTAWLADPAVYAVNRLRAHSDHACWPRPPATAMDRSQQSLDGEWRVRVVTAPTSPSKSDGPDYQPGCVVRRSSFGVPGSGPPADGRSVAPQYVNVQYPWDGHEDPKAPAIPEHGHVAVYARVRRGWRSRPGRAPRAPGDAYLPGRGHSHLRVAQRLVRWLRRGLLHAQRVRRDGRDQGGRQRAGGRLLRVFERELVGGSGLLASARPVPLRRTQREARRPRRRPPCRRRLGSRHIKGFALAGCAERRAANAATADFALWDKNGTIVWRTATKADGTLHAEAEIDDAAPWSAERPDLYELSVTLLDADGKVLETARTRIGFRHVAIEDGILKLNGKRLVFRGVNRHEFDCRRGRAITEEDMLGTSAS